MWRIARATVWHEAEDPDEQLAEFLVRVGAEARVTILGERLADFGPVVAGQVLVRCRQDDPGLARLARAMLESSEGRAAPPMTSQVRGLVVLLLGTGSCTVERAAEYLGVDRRTVHRYLARESETFSGVVESVRKELAVRYVRDQRQPLAEVAALLTSLLQLSAVPGRR